MSRYKRYISIEEFLTLLEKTPRQWEESADGDIRMNCRCPLAAVFGGVDLDKNNNVGLSKRNKDRIIAASDTTNGTQLRIAILAACGLQNSTKLPIDDDDYDYEVATEDDDEE